MSIIGGLFHLKHEDWMDEARCGTKQQRAGVVVDPDNFWPEKGQPDMTSVAKALCRECPVRVECLEYALKHEEMEGVWGGLSDKQRRNLLAGRPIDYVRREPRNCKRCARTFTPRHGSNFYCSKTCRRTTEAERVRAKRHGAA